MQGAAKKGTQVVGNGLYLPGCIEGSVVNFLVYEEMKGAGGRAAEILGPTVLGGGTDARMHGTSETGSDPGHTDGTLGLCGDQGHPWQ